MAALIKRFGAGTSRAFGHTQRTVLGRKDAPLGVILDPAVVSSQIPPHGSVDPGPYDTEAQNWIGRAPNRFHAPPSTALPQTAVQIKVGRSRVNWSGQIMLVNSLQLVIPQNLGRIDFVLHNASTNANSLFYSYKNNPQGLLELVPGEKLTEEGVSDEIWIQGPVVGQAYTVYEGVPDDRTRILHPLRFFPDRS